MDISHIFFYFQTFSSFFKCFGFCLTSIFLFFFFPFWIILEIEDEDPEATAGSTKIASRGSSIVGSRIGVLCC